MKKPISIIFLCLFLFTCQSSPALKTSQIKTVNIAGVPLQTEEEFALPREIGFVNGRLIVIDELKGNQYFGTILGWDAESKIWAKEHDFAPKGSGPGETPFLPNFYKQVDHKDNAFGFWLHDVANSKYLHFKSDKKWGQGLIREDSVTLPQDQFGLIDQMWFTADSKILATASGNKGRLLRYDADGNDISYSEKVPELPESINGNNVAFAYKSHIAYQEEKRLIAAAMEWFGRIDFFDSDLKHLGTYELPDYTEPKFFINGESMTNEENEIYFVDIQSGTEYFYVLLIDKTEQKAIGNPSCSILKFSWEGLKPVVSYELEGILLTSFTVDEQNGKVYGLNPLNEQQPIYVFNLDM